MKKLLIQRLNNNINLPFYATTNAAGLDISANLTESIILKPNESIKIKLGFKTAIPEGHYGAVHIRSSVGCKHRVVLNNGTGIIDSDYRGEWMIFLSNEGDKDFVINHNDRIAQVIIHKYKTVQVEEVEELPETTRGAGGLGSTGK